MDHLELLRQAKAQFHGMLHEVGGSDPGMGDRMGSANLTLALRHLEDAESRVLRHIGVVAAVPQQAADHAESSSFVGRMRQEEAQLSERLTKLVSFIEGDFLGKLPKESQNDLHAQRKAMEDYLAVLRRRMERHSV